MGEALAPDKAVDQWVEATGAGPFFHLGEHGDAVVVTRAELRVA